INPEPASISTAKRVTFYTSDTKESFYIDIIPFMARNARSRKAALFRKSTILGSHQFDIGRWELIAQLLFHGSDHLIIGKVFLVLLQSIIAFFPKTVQVKAVKYFLFHTQKLLFNNCHQQSDRHNKSTMEYQPLKSLKSSIFKVNC